MGKSKYEIPIVTFGLSQKPVTRTKPLYPSAAQTVTSTSGLVTASIVDGNIEISSQSVKAFAGDLNQLVLFLSSVTNIFDQIISDGSAELYVEELVSVLQSEFLSEAAYSPGASDQASLVEEIIFVLGRTLDTLASNVTVNEVVTFEAVWDRNFDTDEALIDSAIALAVALKGPDELATATSQAFLEPGKAVKDTLLGSTDYVTKLVDKGLNDPTNINASELAFTMSVVLLDTVIPFDSIESVFQGLENTIFESAATSSKLTYEVTKGILENVNYQEKLVMELNTILEGDLTALSESIEKQYDKNVNEIVSLTDIITNFDYTLTKNIADFAFLQEYLLFEAARGILTTATLVEKLSLVLDTILAGDTASVQDTISLGVSTPLVAETVNSSDSVIVLLPNYFASDYLTPADLNEYVGDLRIS